MAKTGPLAPVPGPVTGLKLGSKEPLAFIRAILFLAYPIIGSEGPTDEDLIGAILCRILGFHGIEGAVRACRVKGGVPDIAPARALNRAI